MLMTLVEAERPGRGRSDFAISTDRDAGMTLRTQIRTLDESEDEVTALNDLLGFDSDGES